MLSYDSVMRIPTDIRLHIIDAIDTRDHIIDHVLKNIEKKHDTLIDENEKLKKQLEIYEKEKEKQIERLQSDITEIQETEIKETKIKETKIKTDDICKSFENRNYVHIDNKNIEAIPIPAIHRKIYEAIYEIIQKEGYWIDLTNLDDMNVRKQIEEIEMLNIASMDAMDAMDVMEAAYDYKTRPKKLLSSLTNILTDYVSENVYVEKVLDRLDTIINFMNNDSEFIKYIFQGIIDQGIIDQEEEGKLGIIFKGGNVYKLFSEILDRNLDSSIFHHYVSDIDNYFKKSDCDFSIVLIATNKNKKRFIHLERTKENEANICTLQYMVLNKFRNDFLHESNGYEYLNMCGINDSVILKKMKRIGERMKNQIYEGRLEFESKLFTLMVDTIQFESSTKPIKYLDTFKSLESIKQSFTIIWPTPDNQTLRGILKLNAKDFTNRGTVFNVTKGNILDWYNVFLSQAMRNDDQFSGTVQEDDKFINLTLTPEIIKKIHEIETDSMQWKDIRILYNVKEVANIIIGNNNYQIDNKIPEEEIFRQIVSNEKPTDKIAEILARRMRRAEKLTSNRNDFFIKFTKNESHDILNIDKIPFDRKDSTTPFYISINKEITGQNAVLQKQSNIPYWLQNMKRYYREGSHGYETNSPNPYQNVYTKLIEQMKKEEREGKMIGQKSINFGLGRLMLSFSIVFKTYTNNYIALPIPGEYIDLSYSYASDYKTLIYESYEGYILLNEGMLGHHSIETIIHQYNEVIEYAKSNEFIDTLVEHLFRNAKLESDAIVKGLYEMNYEIITSNELIEGKINQIITETRIPIDLRTLLRILKYYGDINKSSMKFNTIYFPKLNGFIMDLYSILFIDSKFPWTDQKYAKRLQRYIFFIFIEQLQGINIRNIDRLLKDIGLNPGIFEIMKKMETNSKSMNDTFLNLLDYSNARSDTMSDIDNDQIVYDGFRVQSIGAIDRFMFGYHLLDFLNIYKFNDVYVRLQFVVKHRINDEIEYILVSIDPSDLRNGLVEKIVKTIPQTYEEFNDGNKNRKVKLKNGRKVPQYEIIRGKFLNYIKMIHTIREKLIITIYNYMHREILNSKSEINVVQIDPIRILLNTYEGEIDKILRVIP